MNHQQAYYAAYANLFALVMSGKTNSPEAEILRQQMDQMRGSDADKIQWGLEVGWHLYGPLVQ